MSPPRSPPSAAGWGAAPRPSAAGYAAPVYSPPDYTYDPPPSHLEVTGATTAPLAVDPNAPEQLHAHISHLQGCLDIAQAENKSLMQLVQDLARTLYPQQFQEHRDRDPQWQSEAKTEDWEKFFQGARTLRAPLPVPTALQAPPAPPAGEHPDTATPVAERADAPAVAQTAGDGHAQLQDDGSWGDPGELMAEPEPPASQAPLLHPDEAASLWAVRQLHQRNRGAELERLLRSSTGLATIKKTEWGELVVPGAKWPHRDRHPWTRVLRLWPDHLHTSHMLLNWWAAQPDPTRYRLPEDEHETICHLWRADTGAGRLRHGVLFVHGQTDPTAYGTLCIEALEGPGSLTCVLPSHVEAAALQQYLRKVDEGSVRVETMPLPRGQQPQRTSAHEAAHAETYPSAT